MLAAIARGEPYTSGGKASLIKLAVLGAGDRALLHAYGRPSQPATSNSANAIQGNSVTGAYSGGSQPDTEGGLVGISVPVADGNAVNSGPVTSGNRKPIAACHSALSFVHAL